MDIQSVRRYQIHIEGYPMLHLKYVYCRTLQTRWKNLKLLEKEWLRNICNGFEKIEKVIETLNETLVIYVITKTDEITVTNLLSRDKGVRIASQKIAARRLTNGIDIEANCVLVVQDENSDLRLKSMKQGAILNSDLISKYDDMTKLTDKSQLSKEIQNLFEEPLTNELEDMSSQIQPFLPTQVGGEDFRLTDDSASLMKEIKKICFSNVSHVGVVVKSLPKEMTKQHPASNTGLLANGEVSQGARHGRINKRGKQVQPPNLKEYTKRLNKSVVETIKKNTSSGLIKRYGESADALDKWCKEYGLMSKIEKAFQLISVLSCGQNGISLKTKAAIDVVSHEVEEYVGRQMEIVKHLTILNFELRGLLSERNDKNKIISKPVPSALQQDLLKIDEVFGCGTFCGDFTIFVTKILSKHHKQRIKTLLTEHKCSEEYKTHLVRNIAYNADVIIETGDKIWSLDSNTGLPKYGSICCFCNIKENNDKSPPSLHATTCAHCVPETNENTVYIGPVEALKAFGERKYMVYHPHGRDFVTIEVNRDMIDKCEVRLLSYDSMSKYFNDWTIFSDSTDGKWVFKYGATTGLTKGVVLGSDIAMRKMNDKELGSGGEFTVDNILIATQSGFPPPNTTVQSDEFFSEKGDSGAAICMVHGKTVSVLGVVCGGFRDESSGLNLTYGINMQKAVRDMENTHRLTITPARANKL